MLAIAALSLVVVVGVVHGLGHVIAARAVGHRVHRPWLHLIPGWGCVACSREPARSWPRRAVVHLGGVVASYVAIAAIAFVGLAIVGGRTGEGRWQVSRIQPGMPADGVLRVDDVVLAVNGEAVAAPRAPLAPALDRAGDRPVQIDIVRGGQPAQVVIQAVLDPATGHRRLGVELGADPIRARRPASAAAILALAAPIRQVRELFTGLWSSSGEPGADPGGAMRIAVALQTAFEPDAVIVFRWALRWSTQLALALVLVELIAGVAAARGRQSPAPPV